MPDRSDEELVASVRAGDSHALATIYRRYANPLFDFCVSVLRDRTDAADATQEVFLLAAQRLGQLRRPAKLRSWLFAIARREALRMVRRRSRVQPAADIEELAEPAGDPTGDAADDPARAAEQADLRRVVEDAAAGLEARDRQVLDLQLRHGMESRELADALGVSENHAGVIMHRVRDRFSRALGAALVGRRGRGACPRLRRLLAGWDGRFSPLIRKRVARHLDGCDTCTAVRARLASPEALLGRLSLVQTRG